MNRLKVFWKKVFDLLDDVLAYFLTLVGIMVSHYLPLLNGDGEIVVSLSRGRIVVAAIAALVVIGLEERLQPDEVGDKLKSKVGRKKHFKQRMFNALLIGIGFSDILQKIHFGG